MPIGLMLRRALLHREEIGRRKDDDGRQSERRSRQSADDHESISDRPGEQHKGRDKACRDIPCRKGAFARGLRNLVVGRILIDGALAELHRRPL